MKPSLLSAQLALCPSLGRPAVVGLDLAAIESLAPQPQPIACLLPIGEEAEGNDLQNATRQLLRERFEVLLLLDSSAHGPAHTLEQLDELRAELWLALVGWAPAPGREPVEYAGGELLRCDKSRVLYRHRFVAPLQLGRSKAGDPAETWHERQLDNLPPFTGITVHVDAIDPADPNLRQPGPDGRIEMTFQGAFNP
ncbi:hypothetical protein P0Y43_07405 [Pseudomonas entomophila]|uniref:phage tail terminator protein n=1 Tax=Pseudomonas entomophila TaxID=312306 RepID=UPI0023D7C192|nr:hypothetical protein [Pseudomonas entomophila]MDF0730560.1 hypothetical protein [Pseudomonas entomophila]